MPTPVSCVQTQLHPPPEHITVVTTLIMIKISATAQLAIKTAQTVKPKPMEQCLTLVPVLAMPITQLQTTGLLPLLASLPRLTPSSQELTNGGPLPINKLTLQCHATQCPIASLQQEMVFNQ